MQFLFYYFEKFDVTEILSISYLILSRLIKSTTTKNDNIYDSYMFTYNIGKT